MVLWLVMLRLLRTFFGPLQSLSYALKFQKTDEKGTELRNLCLSSSVCVFLFVYLTYILNKQLSPQRGRKKYSNRISPAADVVKGKTSCTHFSWEQHWATNPFKWSVLSNMTVRKKRAKVLKKKLTCTYSLTTLCITMIEIY